MKHVDHVIREAYQATEIEYCTRERIRYLTLTFIALRNLATIDESKMKVPVLKRMIDYGIHCV